MRLNPNHNIIQLTFFSLSVAALCLLTVALKGNRVQAAQNQKIAKSIRLMPHMKSIRQADSASVPASPSERLSLLECGAKSIWPLQPNHDPWLKLS